MIQRKKIVSWENDRPWVTQRTSWSMRPPPTRHTSGGTSPRPGTATSRAGGQPRSTGRGARLRAGGGSPNTPPTCPRPLMRASTPRCWRSWWTPSGRCSGWAACGTWPGRRGRRGARTWRPAGPRPPQTYSGCWVSWNWDALFKRNWTLTSVLFQMLSSSMMRGGWGGTPG